MQSVPPELVSDLLALSAAPLQRRGGAAADDEASSVGALSRRGLSNVQNTCFLNATLQALLACPPFWQTCERVQATLQPLDPSFATLDDSSHANGTGVGAASSELARALPITHELLTFAAHFRRRERQQRQRQQTQADGQESASAAASASSVTTADAAAVEAVPSESDAAVTAPSASSDADGHSAAAAAATADSAASASASPSKPSATAAPAAVAKSKKPKPSASGGKKDPDDAFLDTLLAASDPAEIARRALEEEERKRAKNRKKKERARLAAKQAAAALQPQGGTEADGGPADAEAGENDADASALANSMQRMEPSSAAAAAPSSSDAAPAVAADGSSAAVGKKKNKKKQKAEGDSAAPETAPTAESSAESATAAAAESAAAAEALVAEDSAENLAAATANGSTAPATSRKQQRVHRVEDEEEWEIAPAGKGKQQQGKGKAGKAASAAPNAASKQKPAAAAASSAPSASSSVTIAAPSPADAPLLGVAPMTAPFLPSFPALLAAFRSHRVGQQEDSQELFQILCENVQEEWNRFTAPWRSATAAFPSASDASSGTTDASDEWSEVGKGSRAIRVVSNLSFVHTPLSRLFCGRVRTQLSVQSRQQDTMSFQPFWSLHLGLDDSASSAAAAAHEDALIKGMNPKAATQARHRRKAPVLSVEKALERYMCPSEISGYKKKSATNDPYGWSAPSPTTRALHMHALDSHSLPRILVLHLKRFEQGPAGGGFGQRGAQQLHKSLKHVQFHRRLHLPPSYLSTAAVASSSFSAASAASASSSASAGGVSYDLCAVVVHHGHSMQGGHYTAYVRDTMQEPQQTQVQTGTAAGQAKAGGTTKAAGKKPPAASRRPPSSDSDDEDTERSSAAGSSSSDDASARDIWFHCDDARITPVAAHTVYAQAAYLLFYTLDEHAARQQDRAR